MGSRWPPGGTDVLAKAAGCGADWDASLRLPTRPGVSRCVRDSSEESRRRRETRDVRRGKQHAKGGPGSPPLAVRHTRMPLWRRRTDPRSGGCYTGADIPPGGGGPAGPGGRLLIVRGRGSGLGGPGDKTEAPETPRGADAAQTPGPRPGDGRSEEMQSSPSGRRQGGQSVFKAGRPDSDRSIPGKAPTEIERRKSRTRRWGSLAGPDGRAGSAVGLGATGAHGPVAENRPV